MSQLNKLFIKIYVILLIQSKPVWKKERKTLQNKHRKIMTFYLLL